MKGYLLDTNIPSEMTRSRPAPQVEQWLDQVDDDALFLGVISLSEILRGITRLPESTRRTQLQTWLDEILRLWFEDRILPVTQSIAERLGRWAGERDSKGLTLPVPDGLIAATALEHDLTLVTRNVRDFVG
ncbi:MAG: type II toxin-antitoxin system VapC family toxin [Acidobacteriaceae bacterium]|nr:type II toxin-antitoxin system VapC family toxin [Acidobacteriaceae bacterium]